MLHDDRHVRFNDRSIGCVAGYRFGIFQIVEPQMFRSPRRQKDAVRAHRFAILEIKRNRDLRILRTRIEQTRRLMGKQRRIVRVHALAGDIALGYGPAPSADLACHKGPTRAALPMFLPAEPRCGARV